MRDEADECDATLFERALQHEVRESYLRHREHKRCVNYKEAARLAARAFRMTAAAHACSSRSTGVKIGSAA